MGEYIKREEALNALLDEMAGTGYQSRAMNAIRFIPTADVVEVVRCEKCNHWQKYDNTAGAGYCMCNNSLHAITMPNDYCGYSD